MEAGAISSRSAWTRSAAISCSLILSLLSGCERQVPFIDTLPISGYEIQGKVTDRIGNPMPNVAVYLDFIVAPYYTDTVLTRKYFVPDTADPIQAVVADQSNTIVKVLTIPRKVSGWFQATWGGTDSTGNIMSSGIYHIQYLIDGMVVFSYDQLVGGGRVAATDVYGRYTIPSKFLPIASTSVPWFSVYDSSYIYNLQVSNEVILTFEYSPRVKQLPATLDSGFVNFVDVQFN